MRNANDKKKLGSVMKTYTTYIFLFFCIFD